MISHGAQLDAEIREFTRALHDERARVETMVTAVLDLDDRAYKSALARASCMAQEEEAILMMATVDVIAGLVDTLASLTGVAPIVAWQTWLKR